MKYPLKPFAALVLGAAILVTVINAANPAGAGHATGRVPVADR